MQIEDVQKELNEHVKHNPKLVSAMVYHEDIVLDRHCKTVSAVKGKYPSAHTILTNVVQGFAATWQELGEFQIKSKMLKNYHQKVNFPIIPSEILPSYFGDYYDETKGMPSMPISKYIMDEELKPRVIDDLQDLSINGVYNSGTAAGSYGASLDGIVQVCANALADADHPAFKVPLNAITDTNIVDEVTSFERKLPENFKGKIKKIFMSHNNAERYDLRYRELYGDNKFESDSMKTRLGKREIVALPNLTTDLIFAAPEGNLAKLIDKIDNPPRVTDIQVLDYKVKIFMEFWKGYDFMINELAFISNYADANYGIGSTAKNQLYFRMDGVTI